MSFVYFIQGKKTRLVKVGFTEHDPFKRLKACQTGSPDELVLIGFIENPNAYQMEEQIHSTFKHLRSHGEWFSEEILIALLPSMRVCDTFEHSVEPPVCLSVSHARSTEGSS